MESSCSVPSTNSSLHETNFAAVGVSCHNQLLAFRSNSHSPYGDSTGLALDAIVVSPSVCTDYTSNDGATPPPPGGPPLPFTGGKRSRRFKTSFPREKDEFDETPRANGIFASSDFAVQFPDVQNHQSQSQHQSQSPSHEYIIRIQINGNLLEESFLSMRLPPKQIQTTDKRRKGSTAQRKTMCLFTEGMSSKPPTHTLEQMTNDKTLIPGKNMIRYILIKRQTNAKRFYQDTPVGLAEAHVYLWSVYDRIVISDIDGTVTKSDVRGVIDSIILKSYVHAHDGVCEFFSKLVNEEQNTHATSTSTTTREDEGEEQERLHKKGQLRILYLSSRPISLISTTRNYLSQLYQSSSSPQTTSQGNQNSFSATQKADFAEDRIRLPYGPIFLHTGSLGTVLVTELVNKSTHIFKADALERQVALPFIAAGKDSTKNTTIFVAAFGNKDTDKKAYEMAGIETHDIYIINKKSVIASTSTEREYKVEIDDGFTVIDHACCCVDDSSNDSVSAPISGEIESPKYKEIFHGYKDPNLTDAILNRMKTTRVP